MWDSVRNIWVDFNKDLEGYLDFMYLDSRSLVTTGMGNLIDPRSVAENLNWYDRTTGHYATIPEIHEAWDVVKSRTDLASHGGMAFKDLTNLRITTDEIQNLIFSRLDEMESYLKRRPPFRDLETWPADAQLALLSMAWGMGPAFNFPKFQQYASQRRWRDAATECRFSPDVGTIKVRNNRNQQCFHNAALIEEESGDPTQVLWPWHRTDTEKVDGFVCGAGETDQGDAAVLSVGAFDLDLQFSVDPDGFTTGYGGPNVGGHQPPQWFIQYGMDLGGANMTNVYAAFDGHVTRYNPHNPADPPGVYGDQIFVRSNNDGMGCYYTHIQDVPSYIRPGYSISRGDFLGRIMLRAGIPPHLHLALVEIIGSQYVGVNLYQLFLELETVYSGNYVTVRFMQDGSPPVIQWGRMEDAHKAVTQPEKEPSGQYRS